MSVYKVISKEECKKRLESMIDDYYKLLSNFLKIYEEHFDKISNLTDNEYYKATLQQTYASVMYQRLRKIISKLSNVITTYAILTTFFDREDIMCFEDEYRSIYVTVRSKVRSNYLSSI